ncbi:MAG: aminotransferase DegT [Chloroflexi bacterium RBG_16_48_8]|nr:MAG: aminotransferase DegT [Chloroflexi bacterium RBG_16_48_8]
MIPVSEPRITEREREYVLDCLQTGWISSAGRYIEAFETQWAAYCGMKHGVAVCNGTVALSAAVVCLGLEPGDEVIMPTFTIISCALAVVENGGIPVLVDSDPETWTMDVNQVEAKITPRTRAIMPVHIYGHPVDMQPIWEIARAHNLVIIEDAAEAHGAEYKGQRCGSLGDVSCFSFYANKIISTGEGGMVLTQEEDMAERLRSERNLAFQRDRRFYHTALGHNYRMTNIQAAIGLAQFERIEEHIEHKRWMAEAYNERLREFPQLQLPIEKEWAKNVYWMYGVVLADDVPFNAAEFARRLYQKGVETRPFFLGMHEQPVFRERELFIGECYPVSENLSRMGLYLPSGLTLTESQLGKVCQQVHSIFKTI